MTGESELAGYLKCYFLLTEDNGMTTYPYPGSGINGEYTTLSEYAGENVKMIIRDDGQSLSIRLSTPGVGQGSVANVVSGYDYFPFAFDDGGAHYVSGVL